MWYQLPERRHVTRRDQTWEAGRRFFWHGEGAPPVPGDRVRVEQDPWATVVHVWPDLPAAGRWVADAWWDWSDSPSALAETEAQQQWAEFLEWAARTADE